MVTLRSCRPGGLGARQAVLNPALLSGLAQLTEGCDRVMSVCTGAALLAAAGLLEGRWGGREGWRIDVGKLGGSWREAWGRCWIKRESG